MSAWLLLLAAVARAQTAAAPGAPYELPTTSAASRIEYRADEAEYDRNTGRLHLKGGVRIQDPNWVLKSDEVQYDLLNRKGEGKGFVLLETPESAIWGDRGSFDFAGHTGLLTGSSGGYRPWYVQAQTLEVRDDLHLYRKVQFTSCSAVPEPHFHLKASRLTVYPKHWISAANVRVYIGDVPVFYLPYFYGSLGGHSFLTTTVRLGYSGRNGGELQTSTLLRFHPSFYSRLYLDYYTRQGLGTGGEVDYGSENLARASLYAYRIREPNGTERWTLLGNQWQPLGGPYALQARLQLQSDPSFNSDYYRSNAFRVSPELRNSAAIVRQTSLSTTRLLAERLDGASGDSFVREREALPRLEYQTATLPLKWGAVQSVSAFAERAFVRTDGFTHSSAGAAWNAQRTFVVARPLTFVPRLGLSETYADRLASSGTAGTATRTDVLVARYGGGALLRAASPLGDFDFDYDYRVRSEPGRFSADASAPDFGVESSRLGLVHFWRPHRRAYTRVDTGYDLRRFRGSDPEPSARLEPIGGLVGLTLSPTWSFSAQERFDPNVGHESFLMQSDWGRYDGDRIGLGLFNTRARPGKALVSHTASYGRGQWRLTGALRYEVDRDGLALRVYEKLVALDRTFHDFKTFWQIRERAGSFEFAFRVHLLFTYEKRAASTKLEMEREWYPWRDKPDDDR